MCFAEQLQEISIVFNSPTIPCGDRTRVDLTITWYRLVYSHFSPKPFTQLQQPTMLTAIRVLMTGGLSSGERRREMSDKCDITFICYRPRSFPLQTFCAVWILYTTPHHPGCTSQHSPTNTLHTTFICPCFYTVVFASVSQMEYSSQ